MSKFKILSMDGGGLKGLFTISLLDFIEENTGKTISDYFDLIAGTSTGGIIALGLGMGYRPSELLKFYQKEGAIIFPSQGIADRAYRSLKHIILQKYSNKPLQKTLQNYFGQEKLGNSNKRLIIPAFNPIISDVHIYKTAHHKKLMTDYKTPIWEVAMATASAPTYFPVFIDSGQVRLLDGGIWANNPTMIALSEALGYLEQDQEDISLLSIGTTRFNTSTNLLHAKGGKILWASKAIELMLHGQEMSASNQALHILGEERFLRINPTVSKEYQLDRLNNKLIGIGKGEGKKRINEIAEKFLQQKAQEFVPEYIL